VFSDLRRAIELNPLLSDLLPTLAPLSAFREDPRFKDLLG
jgi:hypothetical protein